MASKQRPHSFSDDGLNADSVGVNLHPEKTKFSWVWPMRTASTVLKGSHTQTIINKIHPKR